MIRWSSKELGRSLRALPMLRVLLPVVAGVVAGEWIALPSALLWVGIVGCVGLALTARSSLYAAAALLLLGMGSTDLHHGRLSPPLGERMLIEVEPLQTPRIGEGYNSTPVALRGWCDPEGAWHAAEKRATLYCDSTLYPEVGERLLLLARLQPYGDKYPLFRTLQQRRGFVGAIHASQEELLEREPLPREGLARRLHRVAVERIHRLKLKPESEAVVEAMSVGERPSLSNELRSAYARSGTSHLLAVSGLHVGIVFFALNMVLWALPLAPAGHRIKNLVALLLIWLYALVAGGSPSVLRAAWMFSAMQLSLAFTLHHRSLNILFGVATIMLLLEPHYLFEISFQLSFLSVFAILCWGLPLIRCLRGRFGRWLAGLFVVGAVSVVATAPLGAAQFGLFSPVGVLLNPLVIFTAQVILCSSLAWILLPFEGWQPLFAALIEGVASLQNGIIKQVAGWEFAAIELRPSTSIIILIYLLFVAFTLFIWGLERPQKEVQFLQQDEFDG